MHFKVPMGDSHLACECRHISRLSLVSAENSVCEPEPGSDFCDVGILSQVTPELMHKIFTARSNQVSFCHGIWLAKEKQIKSLHHRNPFPGRGSQTLFLVETCDSRKYVYVCRLTLILLSFRFDMGLVLTQKNNNIEQIQCLSSSKLKLKSLQQSDSIIKDIEVRGYC